MSEINATSVSNANDQHDEDEIGMLDILIAVLKHKKLLFGLPLVIGVVAILISFLMPNYYQASTKLLPPSQGQSTASAMLSQLGGLAGAVGGGALGIKSQSDLYLGMMKSRTVSDDLIKRFDLQTVYEIESLEKTRKALDGKTNITAGKDGLIVIEVTDRDPKRAADIANAYVDELVKLTMQFAITDASQRRVFFEKQLVQTKDKLADAEVALKLALDKSGVVSVDGKSQGMVATVERLRSSISAKDIQLRSMSAFVTPNNVEYKRLQEELSSMRAELSRLENGGGNTDSTDSKPNESGLNSVKILRDVKYYQMLYELLAKQYEAARLDESKDFSMIQVLDKAIVPEFKAGPKRSLIGIGATLFAFILALVYVLWKELAMNSSNHESMEKWRQIKTLTKLK